MYTTNQLNTGYKGLQVSKKFYNVVAMETANYKLPDVTVILVVCLYIPVQADADQPAPLTGLRSLIHTDSVFQDHIREGNSTKCSWMNYKLLLYINLTLMAQYSQKNQILNLTHVHNAHSIPFAPLYHLLKPVSLLTYK